MILYFSKFKNCNKNIFNNYFIYKRKKVFNNFNTGWTPKLQRVGKLPENSLKPAPDRLKTPDSYTMSDTKKLLEGTRLRLNKTTQSVLPTEAWA